MKQKLKKSYKEYDELIRKYKENPVEEELSEEEEFDTCSEVEVPKDVGDRQDEEKQGRRDMEDGWERKTSKKKTIILDKQQFMKDP